MRLVGCKVLHNSIIYGYTEIKNNDIIYRAHPCYQTKDSCYDCSYFKWDGYEQSIPARMMIIINLIDAEISYEYESNTDGEHYSRTVQPIRHLKNRSG